MKRPKVFICYHREDEKALEQLRTFLRPQERRGELEVWDETQILAGQDRQTEIAGVLAEARVAVILISQDLLASDAVVQRQLPAILAAEDRGELTVIPVFLRHSTVAELDISFADTHGQERHARLTRFEGYLHPDRPLADLSWSDRERAFGALADRLVQLCGGRTAQELRPGKFVVKRKATYEPAKLYVLTIRLERQGDTLHVEYRLPGDKPFATAEAGWATHGPRVERLAAEMAAGDLSDHTGDVLFGVLFGAPERWGPILRTLFHREPPHDRPNPPFAPVRLRVATDDPLLLTLPWRLTVWNRRRLVDDGWTFTTTYIDDPTDDYATTAPSSVLIAAPGNDDHPGAVADLLKKVWPTGREAGFVRRARTREQLGNALRGMHPQVLYLYAENDAYPDLPELFRAAGHEPRVIFRNTPGDVPLELLSDIPLVLWRQSREGDEASTTRALAFFRHWLGDGVDPIAAFHAAVRDATGPNSTKHSLDASTVGVHSSYRTWKTDTYLAVDEDRFPDLRLDRDQQKALVAKHVSELARSESRRVMALIAYAAPGNTVERLWEQLRDHLDLAVHDLVEIDWVRLEFPLKRGRLRRDLEYELALQLEADDNEPVPHLLRRFAPNVVGTSKRPVLWLDWGAFGKDHQPSLKPAQLADWLRFSSEYLAIHCPNNVRIVSCIAMETAPSQHERLAKTLQEHRREPWCRTPAFRLSVLPPLGTISEEDLFDFLDEPHNSSCDPTIHAEITERLVAETGGEFEATVALMKEAEAGSWYDLLSRLRRSQGAASPEEDEEPF